MNENTRKIALIGGTGFVGSYVVDALVARGYTPRCLVRRGSEPKLRHPELCERVSGELDDPGAVTDTVAGTIAAIYLVGLLREDPARGATWERTHYEGAVRAMEAAKSAGVGRFVYMSANGVKPDGTGYQSTKYRAEQALAKSGLAWTVFRPSVIFGDPRGRMEFCTQLKLEMIDPPIPAPLFHRGVSPANAGRFRMSPVAVADVAACFAESVRQEDARDRIFPLGGPDALEWRRLLRVLATACGKPNKLMVPAPVGPVRGVAALFERFSWFPVTRDQLQMLIEGNACDGSEAFQLFGVRPLRFDAESLAYLTAPGR